MVIALIALLTGSLVLGSGMLGASRLRAGASLVLSGVRLAITRANASGLPVRLVFDLERERMVLEQAETSQMLIDDEEGPAAGALAKTELEREAEREASRIIDEVATVRPDFTPVQDVMDEGGRDLGAGIVFRQVQTEHDDEPISEGRAYLYFWPGGGTEWASVQLRQDGSDTGLTVMVSPLTGRAKIVQGWEPLPEPRSDGAPFGDRDEDF